MHIVGGLYNEICLHPAWNGLFGSGGRAALTVAAISGEVILHSYYEDADSAALDPYRDHGIQLALAQRGRGVVFAYFHPLSTPYIEPQSPSEYDPIFVVGDAVLRFGFIEGDAIVTAKRAVFDPQGTRDIRDFSANGSSADQLALVLNEIELGFRARGATIVEAAQEIIRRKQADIVVIKRGIRGATVVDEFERIFEIPCFRSPDVFKIGTGDVFSALFAHYWGEQGLDPEAAAYQASAGVANYSTTKRLPLRSVALDLVPLAGRIQGPVQVIGARDTLGRHYLFEEAQHRLRELGVDVQVDPATACGQRPSAILILADGLSNEAVQTVLSTHKDVPVVLLDELQTTVRLKNLPVECVISDFTTALYHAAWATIF